MKRILLATAFWLLMVDVAYGQVPFVGKSRSDQWTQTITKKGHPAWRELAITSTDGKSEMIVEFYPELGAIGMNVSFVDRPYRPCAKRAMEAIGNTSLMLNGKPLPGAHTDSFSAGCAYEHWIERVVLGSVDADVAIVRALLKADQGAVRLSSGDGTFDHSYPVKGFRSLERGGLNAYLHSGGYQLARSMKR